ncbi:MAG: hypothetical protein IPJ25_16180 [Rhodocyclaceae bacterium]|nr:hypothetical protein [Rhodocyclaceae bacterium]
MFTKAASITTSGYTKTAAPALCPAITAPTWTFVIGGTNAGGGNNRKIDSITCGGTNTINTNTVGTTTSTSGDTRRTNLGNGLVANDINGYSYSCNADASTNELTCTVTGPVAAAACTTLSITAHSDISVDSNGSKVQTCPAINNTANSASWVFSITGASADSALFTSVTCGGINTITTSTVSTGISSSNAVTRINNLKTAIASNAASGYGIACTTATAGTPQSDCTITGPAGTNACQGTDADTNGVLCGVGQFSFRYNGNDDGSGIALSGSGLSSPDNGGTWLVLTRHLQRQLRCHRRR